MGIKINFVFSELFQKLLHNEKLLTQTDELVLENAFNKMRDAVMLSFKDYFNDVITAEDIMKKLNSLDDDEREKVSTDIERKVEEKLYGKVKKMLEKIFTMPEFEDLSVEDLLFLTIAIRYLVLNNVQDPDFLNLSTKELFTKVETKEGNEDIYR